MVLVQFLITKNGGNNKEFVVPISGKCSIRVLKIDYFDDDNTHHCYPIQIQSDILFFPYSPQRYLTFLSHPSHASTVDSGYKEYNIYSVIPGKIRLNVVNAETGAQPTDFEYCVLTLECELLNRDFDVER